MGNKALTTTCGGMAAAAFERHMANGGNVKMKQLENLAHPIKKLDVAVVLSDFQVGDTTVWPMPEAEEELDLDKLKINTEILGDLVKQ